jgi:thiamine kinase-like enzyme
MEPRQILVKTPFKTVYREGNRLIKLFEATYTKADVLNEALNHARAEETGIRVPALLEVGIIDGKWAIQLEYVEGKNLAEMMKEHPERKAEYLEHFVDLQMEMFAQRAPLMNKLKDKMKRKIEETDLDANVRYDLFTRLEGMPRHNKLCHGDFNPTNIVIAADSTAYIVDWAHATQGNASADVARTYLLFHLEGEAETAERYLDLFCAKSGTAKKYVQSWLSLVAASQLASGKPEEREFLLRWINVVDYE